MSNGDWVRCFVPATFSRPFPDFEPATSQMWSEHLTTTMPPNSQTSMMIQFGFFFSVAHVFDIRFPRVSVRSTVYRANSDLRRAVCAGEERWGPGMCGKVCCLYLAKHRSKFSPQPRSPPSGQLQDASCPSNPLSSLAQPY